MGDSPCIGTFLAGAIARSHARCSLRAVRSRGFESDWACSASAADWAGQHGASEEGGAQRGREVRSPAGRVGFAWPGLPLRVRAAVPARAA